MIKIINFHELHDSIWFDSVVSLLKSKYTMISAQDMYDFFYKGKRLKNACLLTVDDGHETSYSVIYPILKKYKVPAIFFVSPYAAVNSDNYMFWFQSARQLKNKDSIFSTIHNSNICIDDACNLIDNIVKTDNVILKYNQNMTVDQIKQIDSEGLVTIGAHTLTHPFLGRESDERSFQEITESVIQLENLLGHEVLYFAYPNGKPNVDWGSREVKTLMSTSIKLSFSTLPRNVRRKDRPYEIPRYGLSRGSIRFVKIKLFLGHWYPMIKKAVNSVYKIK